MSARAVGVLVSLAALGACSPDDRGDTGGNADGGGGGRDGFTSPFVDGGPVGPQEGCGELENCYTVWASSDTVLYHLDLVNRALVEIGPFNQSGGSMTDIAVAPDDTLWGVTETALYRVSRVNGQATQVAPLEECGTFGVGLTFTADGRLWAGDYNGAFCRIDIASDPPEVIPVGNLSNSFALSGDLVAVDDGTIFGTAISLNDSGTMSNNVLVKIVPETGQTTRIGSIGFDRLFGVAFDQGQIFAFSHDGSGEVVRVDPDTGAGEIYNTFEDDGGTPITFSGAAVNPHVRISID